MGRSRSSCAVPLRHVGAALAIAVASTGHPARADTVSFNDSGSVAISSPTIASLSKFDPALGALNQVTIDLTVRASNIIQVIGNTFDSEDGSAGTVQITIGTSVNAVGPSMADLTADSAETSTVGAVGADNDGAADFVGTDSFAFAIAQIFFSDGFDTTVLNSALGPYTGIDTFDLTLTASLIETIDANKNGGGTLVGVTENALRPTGATYSVDLTYDFAPPPPGDFNGDIAVNADDIDLLFAEVAAGTHDPFFELTGDAFVDQDDVDELVLIILGSLFGDANLDITVSFADFVNLQNNFSQAGWWEDGDFNGDVLVTFADFAQLQNNFGQTGTGAPASVPEPATICSIGLGALALLRRRRPKAANGL